jgi:arabinogalactan endo-1,4-beta-galactosidase
MTVVLASTALYGRTETFILGADISWLPEDEARGTTYYDGFVKKDALQIMKEHGFNDIRLRIFNNPKAASGGSAATTGAVYAGYSAQGFCDLEHTKAMALRVKAAGMRFTLDFHYSDNWADPGKQYKPHAWADASFSALQDSVRLFTKYVVSELKKQGTTPHMVQVGNEITAGMIWPDGRTGNWANLAALIKAGIAGVKEVDSTIKIILHIDKGGDNAATRSWVDNAIAKGIVFDVLGESCYTKWQGEPGGWKSNFADLVKRYPKLSFIIAEYSWEKRAANDVMFNLPGEKGLGTFIWEPLQYEESFLTQSGTKRTTNSLIDLYPQMVKDYGMDTVTTMIVGPAGGAVQSSNRPDPRADGIIKGPYFGEGTCKGALERRATFSLHCYDCFGRLREIREMKPGAILLPSGFYLFPQNPGMRRR